MAKFEIRPDDEDSLVRRAFAAYYKFSDSWSPDQPSNTSGIETVGGKDYVVLRNVNGILAVYRVRNDGMLKGLKRWPAGLEDE